MKAMVLEKTGPLEDSPLQYRDIDTPRPGPSEVLIRVSCCGMCHTDLHTVEGELDLPKLPVIPGHQVVGTVVETGPGVDKHKPGDRVGLAWLAGVCGKCRFCRSGRENLCRDAHFNGLHRDGGYAEFVVSREDFAFPLPESFSDLQAAPLLCAGIIGYRAFRLSGVGKGDKLAMFGFGASAHITIQVAIHLGREVYVFTRNPKNRELAESLGAVWTGTSKDRPSEPLNGAIIFAPDGRLVIDALEVLDRGAAIALAGIYMTPIPQLDYSLLYHERAVRSVANFTRDDAESLLKIAAEIPIRPEVRQFPLEEANHALLMLKNSEIQGAGVLVPNP